MNAIILTEIFETYSVLTDVFLNASGCMVFSVRRFSLKYLQSNKNKIPEKTVKYTRHAIQ